MSNRIIGIEHALIGVKDLEAATEAYQKLGFTMTPKGLHQGWGTAFKCAMFENDYIELIAIDRPDENLVGLDKFLDKTEGLYRLALGTDDVMACRDAMIANGLTPSELENVTRTVETASSNLNQHFSLARLNAEDSPAFDGFIGQNLTENLMRIPAWLKHANGAKGIETITIVHEKPESLYEAYEKLFGVGTPIMTDETLAVHTGATTLLFVTPNDLAVMYPRAKAEETPRQAPYIAAITLTVDDTAIPASCLSQNGVPFVHTEEGFICVFPEYACGAIICFVPAERATAL